MHLAHSGQINSEGKPSDGLETSKMSPSATDVRKHVVNVESVGIHIETPRSSFN